MGFVDNVAFKNTKGNSFIEVGQGRHCLLIGLLIAGPNPGPMSKPRTGKSSMEVL